MRPNECAGSPSSANQPGSCCSWYDPNFHTNRFSQLERTTFFGAGCCYSWLKTSFSLWKTNSSRCCGDAMLLLGAVVGFLAAEAEEFKYLWACLAKATLIISRLMSTPERQSQNHPESTDWKQRWGPFSKQYSYVRFYFQMVSEGFYSHGTFTLFVLRRDAGGKKSLVDVKVCESEWRGSDSWVFRLYVQLQVGIWTAQICTIPRFLMTKTYKAVRTPLKPDVVEGGIRHGKPPIINKIHVYTSFVPPFIWNRYVLQQSCQCLSSFILNQIVTGKHFSHF